MEIHIFYKFSFEIHAVYNLLLSIELLDILVLFIHAFYKLLFETQKFYNFEFVIELSYIFYVVIL